MCVFSYSVHAQAVKGEVLIECSTQEILSGKQLLLKSDCSGCHSPQVKLVGPTYVDIAKKYPVTAANVTKLAQKIIKGGSGVWGKIPMAPHQTLTEAQAKNIVKYILSEF